MTVAPARVSTSSLEYVRVRVVAEEAGAAVNPTADTVKMAFISDGSAPVGDSWKTASWETDATGSPTVYYARCLVGVGGAVTLAANTYAVWVQVTDNPEIPVHRAGKLVVF